MSAGFCSYMATEVLSWCISTPYHWDGKSLSSQWSRSRKLENRRCLPLLKKSGLDLVYNNFPPVSNLPFISKVVEKAAIQQLLIHCEIVRNLGSWFDAHMRMNVHISKICRKAFRGLYNIKQIRKFLTVQSTKTLAHAFISSHLDYCNALLFGLPKYQLDRLQKVQNAAARVII